jgi:hypothetical protein
MSTGRSLVSFHFSGIPVAVTCACRSANCRAWSSVANRARAFAPPRASNTQIHCSATGAGRSMQTLGPHQPGNCPPGSRSPLHVARLPVAPNGRPGSVFLLSLTELSQDLAQRLNSCSTRRRKCSGSQENGLYYDVAGLRSDTNRRRPRRNGARPRREVIASGHGGGEDRDDWLSA